MPDCLQRPYNWKRVGLLGVANSPYKARVLALVAMAVLCLCLALTRMEVAQTVLVKWRCVRQALHGRIEEAGVAVVLHRESHLVDWLGFLSKHQLISS